MNALIERLATDDDTAWIFRYLYNGFQYVYGDVSPTSLPRISWLSGTLCSIIGSFWLLDSLKDTIFATMVGLEYIPLAKVISVFVTLLLVFGYNRLLDSFSKIAVFYVICTCYGVLFLIIALCLADESLGMENTTPSPYRIVAWVSYFAIESYGSLSVALFWAFANATINLEEAKSTYGLIIALAQFGAIVGSTMATRANVYGVSALYALAGFMVFNVVVMVYGYALAFPRHLPSPPDPKREKSSSIMSMLEGLLLVLRHRYVTLILGISCLYEVVLTYLDYEMKIIGRARYGNDARAAEQFAELMGHFGQVTNVLSFIFSLTSTSLLLRYLGLRRTLRVFPVLLFIAVILSYFYPSLVVLFASMSFLKALTYALNEPTKELLYSPTSEDIKFKAKAWIDVFGARVAKAAGSAITHSSQGNPDLLVKYGSFPSILISIALLATAVVVGKRFDHLVQNGLVVGRSDEGDEASDFLLKEEDRTITHNGVKLHVLGPHKDLNVDDHGE